MKENTGVAGVVSGETLLPSEDKSPKTLLQLNAIMFAFKVKKLLSEITIDILINLSLQGLTQ